MNNYLKNEQRFQILVCVIVLVLACSIQVVEAGDPVAANHGRLLYDEMIQDVTTERTQQSVGRLYYNSLIEKAKERHWITYLLLHNNFADEAFVKDSCNNALSSLIFCKDNICIKDIFLLSKLSDDRKAFKPV